MRSKLDCGSPDRALQTTPSAVDCRVVSKNDYADRGAFGGCVLLQAVGTDLEAMRANPGTR
jgi:hypothetical protein